MGKWYLQITNTRYTVNEADGYPMLFDSMHEAARFGIQRGKRTNVGYTAMPLVAKARAASVRAR